MKKKISTGYPHRIRFKAFNARYRLIAPFKQLRRAEEQAVEDTKLILQNAQQVKTKFGASTSWALGKRHIFLSEGIRQQLENLRSETRRKAATVIQVCIKYENSVGEKNKNMKSNEFYILDRLEGLESEEEMANEESTIASGLKYWT